MRRFIVAAGALISVAAINPLWAADLPVKVPPAPPPAPVYNWTGFYAGMNLGYGIGDDPTTLTTVAGANFEGGTLASGTPIYSPSSFSIDPKGVIGGGQIGYNWQIAPTWVAGLEADIQGSGMRNQRDCVVPCGLGVLTQSTGPLTLFPVTFSTFSQGQKIEWFGTARGRFGYAAGPVLVYATGGLAYGEVNRNGSVVGQTTFLGIAGVNTPLPDHSAQVQLGPGGRSAAA